MNQPGTCAACSGTNLPPEVEDAGEAPVERRGDGSESVLFRGGRRRARKSVVLLRKFAGFAASARSMR